MFKEETFKHKDREVFYRSAGDGKPVVLLHGFGEDGRIWDKQLEHLKHRFRVIVPDLPGSGQSEIDSTAESMTDFAETIFAMLLHANIGSCAMIGHSMGGYITLAFADRHPNMLNSFGLFHSSAYADDEEKKATRRKGIEFIQQHGPAKFLAQLIPNLFSADFKKENPGVIKEIIDRYANFKPEALVQYYESMMKRPDTTEVLKLAKVPVLFILGEHDTVVPLEKGLELSFLPEFSYIHLCKQSGHMGMLEETDSCNKALDDFLHNV